ncbi:hypothetical protein PENTCL1PPCAC_10345 [Pristionchus entomophagus]|uniref:Aladin seven-bladed propeller domain-containing protein n=1 Tax=Pristionchus entomophagus TaxID=358040 RepID=A0AAV5T7A7_9BILA|nr:hypothetical protein PENTCL1PPCAC_10345 [Pristionchus entomophagus]
MSLLNFPPPSVQECSYALQEFNGQIIAGTRKQFETLQNSKFLIDYPHLERTSLSKLQHSLSRDDVKGAFMFRRSTANVLREIDEKLGASTEENDENAGGGWSKAVLRMRNGLGGMLSKMVSADAQTSLADALDRYAATRGWSQSWLRCVAVDGEGGRVAVCQSTDYIRIYGIGADAQQPPLTLHHAQMKNVAAMQFDPHDARLLAVAAGANVLVWRLSGRIVGTKPSGQCIRVVETGVSPLSSLVWDSAWGNSVMVASCTTNKIILADLSTGAHSSVGAWFGGGVTGLYPSRDGTRLAVTYTTNVLRIYDRATWTDEKWGGLAGRATGVVWSPTGESLIFSTEDSETLFALSFSKNVRTGEDGVKMITWSSATRATSIFDLSPIEFDPLKEATEEMLDHSNLRAVAQIGGPVRSMACSADGERLALTFTSQECAGFIATFIVDWASLPLKLYPTGFVEAAFSGTPECVFFLPQYSAGSMLAISWSSGSVQYVPLIYGKSAAAAALSVHPLVEPASVHTILEESLGWAGDNSLASVELSSRLVDREDGRDSPICFTEMLKERSMVGKEI